jgi:hypothetical protein
MKFFECIPQATRKHMARGVIGVAALLAAGSSAWAQVPLGAAARFTVLAGTAITCTNSHIAGDVGLSPGTAFVNAGCTIVGGVPPATNAAAAAARTAFLSAYTALADPANPPCTAALASTIAGPVTLLPGVYCTTGALTGTGVLTLDAGGNANATWIFKVGTGGVGALTGTGWTVVMARGGQPCNVYWRVSDDVTMTDSAFKGNILAGSITWTRGSLAGRALASAAATLTDALIVGCGTLAGEAACVDPGRKDHKDEEKHDKNDKHDKHGAGDGHDDDRPGHSMYNPFGGNEGRGKK